MVIQVNTAGGIEPLTDGLRKADSDNPCGHLESEPASRLSHVEESWLAAAGGKTVKLDLPLVAPSPERESYRLIVSERDASEIIASQKVMLARLGRSAEGSGLKDAALSADDDTWQHERFQVWLELRHEIGFPVLRYDAVLAKPAAAVARTAEFLGQPFGNGVAGSA